MTAAENRELIRRYLNKISGQPKPSGVLDEFLANADLKEHIEMFEAAFPSYEFIADVIVAEDDKVAVHATFRGVHKNELMGMAATGKTISMTVTIIYRIAGGKIAGHWMDYDGVSFMQQIGATHAAA